MIVNFRVPGVEMFFRAGQTQGIRAGHARRLGMVLAMLDVAQNPQELNQVALRLQPVRGGRPEQWSAWVDDDWQLVFRFVGVDVDVIDYRAGN
jgi:proteic killer suppression protein